MPTLSVDHWLAANLASGALSVSLDPVALDASGTGPVTHTLAVDHWIVQQQGAGTASVTLDDATLGVPAGKVPMVWNGFADTGPFWTTDIEWDASSGALGYRVYIGSATGEYDYFDDVGSVTGVTLTLPASKWYVAVTAWNTDGESGYSNELTINLNSGVVSATLEDATLVATSAIDRTGSLSAVLDDATLSASATVKHAGALSATLEDAAFGATGTLEIQGQVSASLSPATVTATGQGEAVPLTGQASIALTPAAISATGELDIAGAVSVTLADATLAADSVVGGNTGTLSAGLEDAQATADATLETHGQASVTLEAASVSAAGVIELAGAASVTLDNATLSATLAGEITGATDAALADATLAATGIHADRLGELAVTLASVTLTATAALGAVDSTTPGCRTYVVPINSRTYVVPVNSRTFTVAA